MKNSTSDVERKYEAPVQKPSLLSQQLAARPLLVSKPPAKPPIKSRRLLAGTPPLVMTPDSPSAMAASLVREATPPIPIGTPKSPALSFISSRRASTARRPDEAVELLQPTFDEDAWEAYVARTKSSVFEAQSHSPREVPARVLSAPPQDELSDEEGGAELEEDEIGRLPLHRVRSDSSLQQRVRLFGASSRATTASLSSSEVSSPSPTDS